jgi:hypothetical protein
MCMGGIKEIRVIINVGTRHTVVTFKLRPYFLCTHWLGRPKFHCGFGDESVPTIRQTAHVALYPQKLALTSLTSGGRSVGAVRSRTHATELPVPTCNNPQPVTSPNGERGLYLSRSQNEHNVPSSVCLAPNPSSPSGCLQAALTRCHMQCRSSLTTAHFLFEFSVCCRY